MPTQHEDPGWGAALRSLPFALSPQLAGWRARKMGFSKLEGLRLMFLSFVVPLLLILVILTFLTGGEGSWSTLASRLVQGVVTVLGYAAILWRRKKPLTGATPKSVAGAFATGMFFSIAFAVAIALVGVALFFRGSRDIWIYGVALVLAGPCLALAAPSVGEVARRQQQLDDAGSDLDLLGALLVPVGEK